jgi:hypothetical protein
MQRFHRAFTAVAIVFALGLAVQPGSAAVKVRVNFDKMFDFTKAKTWSWSPKGAGQVVAARDKDDDPEAVNKRVEPIMFEAVTAEMSRRGLKPATGAPDLTLMYYVLLTAGSSSQTLGQFLPATAAWGLPPFSASTTSIEMMEQGSLVIDMLADGRIVWRGVGEAKIKPELDAQKRAELLREGVRELLRRFPPKS